MSTRSKLTGNVIALYALKGANILFPLATVPYLLRVLGLGPYGAIAYATAVVQIIAMVTSFTFNYNSIPLLANAGEDRVRIGQILSTVSLARVALLAVSLVVLAVATFAVPQLREQWLLIAVQVPVAANEILFPVFIFMGLQRMALITLLNVISRGATLLLLFVLVHSPDDVVWAAGIQASHFVISGILAQAVMLWVLKVGYRNPLPRDETIAFLRDSARTFVAMFSAQVYLRGSVVILGFFVSDAALGQFAVAQRIGSLVTTSSGPLTWGVFPHASRLWIDDQSAFHRLRRRMVGAVAVGSTAVMIVLNVFAPWVVELLAGEPSPQVVVFLQWLTPSIIVTSAGMTLVTLLMAAERYALMERAYLIAAGLFLLSAPPLCFWFGGIGMAIALLLVELWIVGCSYYFSREKRISDRTESPSKQPGGLSE